MKVITQLGLLDINPESVIAIKQAPVMPESLEFSDLTHCVEFDDRYYSMGDKVVCISEADAEKLAELAEVEIVGLGKKEPSGEKSTGQLGNNKILKEQKSRAVFVPFNVQLTLTDWEIHFDDKIAWIKGGFQKPDKEPQPAPPSISNEVNSHRVEPRQSESLIEKAFRNMGCDSDKGLCSTLD